MKKAKAPIVTEATVHAQGGYCLHVPCEYHLNRRPCSAGLQLWRWLTRQPDPWREWDE
jgi:hypothetical protein